MQLKPLEPDDYPFFDYRRFTFSLGIETPEGVWLSGSTAVRHDPETKAMVVQGGLVTQAAVIFEKMEAALVPAGRSLRDLTRLVRYVRSDAIADLTFLDAYQRTVLGDVVVSTIIVERLLRDHALVEMDAAITTDAGQETLPSIIASSAQAAEEAFAGELASRGSDEGSVLRFAQFLTDKVPPVNGRQSITVVCPSLPNGSSGLQIEATLAKRADSRIIHVGAMGDPSIEGIVGQCRDALSRIEAQLDTAGASMGGVIKTTEFIAPQGLSDYRDTATVRRDTFAAPYPAATGVICKGFPEPGCLIAIEAIARIND
ncbi:Rid family hydrolase [Mesorhizobium sp. CAU 1741]|uniref:Rid family hydrolase n=1 Tax=Mesorhizobium sp. CAU 1741 TaxID=3140366 RepID=UPI00325B84A9